MSIRPTDAMLPPPRSEADAKAIRAFWRGMFCGFVLAGVLGGLAGWLS